MRKRFWNWIDPLGRLPFASRRRKKKDPRKPRAAQFETLESRVLMSLSGQIAVDDAYVASESTALAVQAPQGVLANDDYQLTASNWSFDLKDHFVVIPKAPASKTTKRSRRSGP